MYFAIMYRMERGNLLFCTAGYGGTVGRRECAWLLVADGRFVFVCFSVAIMHWTRDEGSFYVEAYFSNAHSIIADALDHCRQTKYAVLEWNNNRLAVTVNSERYLTMIQDFFQTALETMQLEDTCSNRMVPLHTQRGFL